MSIHRNFQNRCLHPFLTRYDQSRMDFQIRVVELAKQESQLYREDMADYVFELNDEPYHGWAECLYVTLADLKTRHGADVVIVGKRLIVHVRKRALEEGLFQDLLVAIRDANSRFKRLGYNELGSDGDARCAEDGQDVLWNYWLWSGFGTN